MKSRLLTWSTYGTPFLLGAIVFALFMYANTVDPKVVQFYQDKMRGSLFAGFLTLGSFLLSLKTGIVIKIKENLFDQPEYQETVVKAQDDGVDDTVYGPLRRLSRVLSAAVLFALVASIAQLTVGLVNSWWAAAACLALGAIAVTFLLIAFTLIQLNLKAWFSHLDAKGEKAVAKMKAEAKAKQPAEPSQFA